MVTENSDRVAQSQKWPNSCFGTEVLKVQVEDHLDFLWIYIYTLTSYDDYPKVVDCLYIEPRLLDIALELGIVVMIYHFFNLVEVDLITSLISIDQDVINVTTNTQIKQLVELNVDEGLLPG
jgi:hypothetical protein